MCEGCATKINKDGDFYPDTLVRAAYLSGSSTRTNAATFHDRRQQSRSPHRPTPSSKMGIASDCERRVAAAADEPAANRSGGAAAGVREATVWCGPLTVRDAGTCNEQATCIGDDSMFLKLLVLCAKNKNVCGGVGFVPIRTMGENNTGSQNIRKRTYKAPIFTTIWLRIVTWNDLTK